MKLNRSLFVAVTIFYTAIVQSQTSEKKYRLEFSVGNTFGFLKSLEFSPVAMYKYDALVYKLNYTHFSKNQNLFEVKTDYFTTNLKADNNAMSKLNTDYVKFGIGLSYLKQLYNKNGLAIHAGLHSQTTVSSYHDTDYVMGHQEFGIAGRFSYQLNEKHYISSKLTLPVILLRATDAQAKFYALDNYQGALWDFEYGYKISKHFDIKAAYNFNYSRLHVLSTYRELQHQLNLSINYKF